MSSKGIRVEIPGRRAIVIEHLVLDVNGTITARGALVDGVAEQIAQLANRVEIHLVSADTYGTLDVLADELGARAERVADGAEKIAYLLRLGPDHCAMVGNGENDVGALEQAALSICVIGLEGASPRALAASDIAVRSVNEAFDLLLEPLQIAATLRP